MRRRDFLGALTCGAAAWPLAATAQQTSSARVVGVLAQDLQPEVMELFRDELTRLGYVEGRNIIIELRDAAGSSARLPALAGELLRRNVDVILAINTPAARAARDATKSVPIVFIRVSDPVKLGLVASLASPGGNVTGLSFMPDELGLKGLEMLREVLPGISRMGVIFQGDNPGAEAVGNAVESSGKQLGLQVLRLPVVAPKDYAGAFESATRAGAQALFVMDDGAITKQRVAILALAAQHRLPVVSVYKDFAKAGALIAYGPRLSNGYRRAAHYVDKLLKGQSASDLPVEQPDKFDLFVNLKTAHALGLTIPTSVMFRADEMIE